MFLPEPFDDKPLEVPTGGSEASVFRIQADPKPQLGGGRAPQKSYTRSWKLQGTPFTVRPFHERVDHAHWIVLHVVLHVVVHVVVHAFGQQDTSAAFPVLDVTCHVDTGLFSVAGSTMPEA